MSMITGIGDEVLEVLLVLVMVAVATIAWWSTAAQPERFQTVIVMERTSRNRPHQLTLVGQNINSIRRHLLRNTTAVPLTITPMEPTAPPEPQDEEGSDSESSGPESAAVSSTEREAVADSTVSERPVSERPVSVRPVSERPASEQAREMDSIVDAMDADTALRNRRNFVVRPAGDSNTGSSSLSDGDKDETPNRASEQANASESVQNENITRSNVDESTVQRNESENATGNSDISDSSKKINIKLKFLNDTFREVDGDPDELLKDFKWRHFSSELSRQLRVLLIFNGHVLSNESSSLRVFGLYHNCVVHCLVQTPKQSRRPAPTVEPAPMLGEEIGLHGPDAEHRTQPAPAPDRPGWDMENILMTLVSIILTIIWFFRCEYSNLFTAAASGALFVLTLFYSVAIFGLYFSDTFHLTGRNREEQVPQPHGGLLT